MNYNELKEVLERLNESVMHLEETYIETEGEVTEETECQEAEVDYLKQLLNTEGVDLLGRWLKSKEDKKKALKAEKDYIARQISANDDSIEFIKAKIAEVMFATGTERVKGIKGYSFATSTSIKTEVDKEILEDTFAEAVKEAVKGILPADVTFTLKASVSALPDDAELPSYYKRTVTPSVRFVKPRAGKEE